MAGVVMGSDFAVGMPVTPCTDLTVGRGDSREPVPPRAGCRRAPHPIFAASGSRALNPAVPDTRLSQGRQRAATDVARTSQRK